MANQTELQPTSIELSIDELLEGDKPDTSMLTKEGELKPEALTQIARKISKEDLSNPKIVRELLLQNRIVSVRGGIFTSDPGSYGPMTEEYMVTTVPFNGQAVDFLERPVADIDPTLVTYLADGVEGSTEVFSVSVTVGKMIKREMWIYDNISSRFNNLRESIATGLRIKRQKH